jgi:hypothetical protein
MSRWKSPIATSHSSPKTVSLAWRSPSLSFNPEIHEFRTLLSMHCKMELYFVYRLHISLSTSIFISLSRSHLFKKPNVLQLRQMDMCFIFCSWSRSRFTLPCVGKISCVYGDKQNGTDRKCDIVTDALTGMQLYIYRFG